MSHQLHTQEPWIAESALGDVIEICSEETLITIAKIYTFGGSARHQANARRIVACVNHCAGIETEKLETSPFTYRQNMQHSIKMREQRDVLLSAAREALAFIELHSQGLVIDAKDSLRLAIANVEGTK